MQFIDWDGITPLPFGDTCALDTETTSVNPREAKLLCIVLANSETAYKVDASLIDKIKPFILSRKLLYLQNFKYDYQVCYRHGLDLNSIPFFDSMLLHHLIDENAEHSLDAQVKTIYNNNYKEVFWAKHSSIEEADYNDALEYMCKDGIYTYNLCERYLLLLEDNRALVDHVHRLAYCLYLTELRGVNVDVNLLSKTKDTMGEELNSYFPKLRQEFEVFCRAWEEKEYLKKLKKLKTEAGKLKCKHNTPFNFGSDSQISWLLYKGLKLPVINKTKKKAPSTDYDTIVELNKASEKLDTLLKYKSIKTMYATFVVGLSDKVESGKLYPSFNVNGTVTGRLSSSNPNMQNMPRDGIIRNFFLPDIECKLIGADFSQLEVIISANMSGDKMLTKSIMEGISLHDITAEGVGIPRDLAKTLNFALQYGAGVHKITKILDCSYDEAKHALDKYWETYSGLKLLIDACHKKVKQGTPIVNPFGRRRRFPTKFATKWQEQEAFRQSFNALVQSTGADITHRATYQMSERLESNGHGRLLWSVHDEILCSIKDEVCEEEKEALVNIMQLVGNELKFKIPLTAKAYGPLERWAKT